MPEATVRVDDVERGQTLAGTASCIDREADTRRQAACVAPAPYPEVVRDKAPPAETGLGWAGLKVGRVRRR